MRIGAHQNEGFSRWRRTLSRRSHEVFDFDLINKIRYNPMPMRGPRVIYRLQPPAFIPFKINLVGVLVPTMLLQVCVCVTWAPHKLAAITLVSLTASRISTQDCWLCSVHVLPARDPLALRAIRGGNGLLVCLRDGD